MKTNYLLLSVFCTTLLFGCGDSDTDPDTAAQAADQRAEYERRISESMQDTEANVALMTQECNSGDGVSCTTLGFMYGSEQTASKDINQDFNKSAEFLSKGCDLNVGIACGLASSLYYGTQGVRPNYKKSYELAEKGCSTNDATACAVAGVIIMDGKGVKRDYAKAQEYLTKGCDLSNFMACNSLGILHQEGKGVRQDYNKSNELYTKSCSNGYASGCINIGAAYSAGRGVRQDYDTAKEYFGKACDLLDQEGCERYKIINLSQKGKMRSLNKSVH